MWMYFHYKSMPCACVSAVIKDAVSVHVLCIHSNTFQSHQALSTLFFISHVSKFNLNIILYLSEISPK